MTSKPKGAVLGRLPVWRHSGSNDEAQREGTRSRALLDHWVRFRALGHVLTGYTIALLTNTSLNPGDRGLTASTAIGPARKASRSCAGPFAVCYRKALMRSESGTACAIAA
jgi:hypothetical protein